jgi:peptide/nickel transport system substrate-binding protein
MNQNFFALKATTLMALLAFGGGGSVLARVKDRTVQTISSCREDAPMVNPRLAKTFGEVGAVSEMFDWLVRLPHGSADPKELQPELVEKWQSSAGKNWTSVLLSGVTNRAMGSTEQGLLIDPKNTGV